MCLRLELDLRIYRYRLLRQIFELAHRRKCKRSRVGSRGRRKRITRAKKSRVVNKPVGICVYSMCMYVHACACKCDRASHQQDQDTCIVPFDRLRKCRVRAPRNHGLSIGQKCLHRRDATLHIYIVVRYRESSVRSHSGVLSIRAKKKKSTRGSFLRVNKSEKAVAKSNRSWLIDLASFS